MDKPEALDKARIYADLITVTFSPKQIFLFGSYAKGNYHNDSDIDIAVVFDDYQGSMEMQLALMRLGRKVDSRIEPHPFRMQDFNTTNPIVQEIVTYGQEINLPERTYVNKELT